MHPHSPLNSETIHVSYLGNRDEKIANKFDIYKIPVSYFRSPRDELLRGFIIQHFWLSHHFADFLGLFFFYFFFFDRLFLEHHMPLVNAMTEALSDLTAD